MLAEMKNDGMSILVSTAYLDEGEKCDHLALMHRSKFLASGTPGEIRAGFPDLETAMIHHIQEVDQELVNDRFKL